jgi:hypothetical protein
MSLLWVRTAAAEWYKARNTADMAAMKRHRQQIMDAHGVKDYQAGIALRPVYQSLSRHKIGQINAKDAGFASSPRQDSEGNDVLPWSDDHPLNEHENWHKIPVTDVPLRGPVHATQDGVGASLVAHNLFHPGKLPPTEWPGQEGTKGLGDPDVDPDTHDHAERAENVGADEASKVPRFYRKNGQLHVADGHHQVAAALLLKKPHIQGRVWDEDTMSREAMAWFNNDVDHDYEEELRPKGETLPERGNRYVQQISQTHGIPPEHARSVAKTLLGHVTNGTMDPREYGFASAAHDRQGHYSIPQTRAIMDHQTWAGKKPEQVDISQGVHATQNYVDPDRVAHNIFHPGKKTPWSESHATGDPDYDPHWDGDEDGEGSGLEMDHDSVQNRKLENHTRFVRRNNGDLEVADGHHRVAADLMLGKTHTPGVVLHENELNQHMRRFSAWEQDSAEPKATHPQTIPVETAGYAGFVSGHGLSDEGDRPHHLNDELMDHLLGHSGKELRGMSQVGKVSIKGRPVYATQSHVTVPGVQKYLSGEHHPNPENLPRFVRHQGNLYVDDGHHRVGAALMRGDDSVHGYYYNADKHGFPEPTYGKDW